MNRFQSKILLFGEYSIIFNSNALTIPYPDFSGEFAFPSPSFDQSKVRESNSELKPFVRYLQSVVDKGNEDSKLIDSVLDLDNFSFEIGQGVFFNSSIPQGYGLGSSGALCACTLDRYVNKSSPMAKDIIEKKFSKENLDNLKKIFQIMEGYFHGSSSGFDPLISYLGVPLIINGDQEIEKVDLSHLKSEVGEGAIFLLNTKRARRTEPLVNLFLEKCKNEEFSKLLKSELTLFSDNCIDAFISKDYPKLFENFKELSMFQYEHFSPMIPKLFDTYWEQGIKSNNFSLKLCGAGGGGFLIGIAKNIKTAKQELNGLDLKVIWNLNC